MLFNGKNKTKKNKKIRFICLLILIVIVMVFGIVYYNNIQIQKTSESPEMAKLKQFLVENCKEFEIPKVNTLTWKTFHDKENGFKFKYPRGWVVEKSNENSWGLKEIWNIRNPEDDEPCSQPKGCWDDSKGEVDYITKPVVKLFKINSSDTKKSLVDLLISSSKDELGIDKDNVLYSLNDYIYIYHDGGYFIFSDSNYVILISKGYLEIYFNEKKEEEYERIYHGIVKTLKFY